MGYPAFPKAGFLIKSKFQIIEKTIVIPQNLVNRKLVLSVVEAS